MIKGYQQAGIRIPCERYGTVNVYRAKGTLPMQSLTVSVPPGGVPNITKTVLEEIPHYWLMDVFNDITWMHFSVGENESSGFRDFAISFSPVYSSGQVINGARFLSIESADHVCRAIPYSRIESSTISK